MLDTGKKAKAATFGTGSSDKLYYTRKWLQGPSQFIIPSTRSNAVNMMIKTVKYWCLIGSLNYVYRTGYDVAY